MRLRLNNAEAVDRFIERKKEFSLRSLNDVGSIPGNIDFRLSVLRFFDLARLQFELILSDFDSDERKTVETDYLKIMTLFLEERQVSNIAFGLKEYQERRVFAIIDNIKAVDRVISQLRERAQALFDSTRFENAVTRPHPSLTSLSSSNQPHPTAPQNTLSGYQNPNTGEQTALNQDTGVQSRGDFSNSVAQPSVRSFEPSLGRKIS